jgi:hypothetical protein
METLNYLHIKTKALSDTPFKFLADPSLNKKKCPIDKEYGEDQVNRNKVLEWSVAKAN